MRRHGCKHQRFRGNNVLWIMGTRSPYQCLGNDSADPLSRMRLPPSRSIKHPATATAKLTLSTVPAIRLARLGTRGRPTNRLRRGRKPPSLMPPSPIRRFPRCSSPPCYDVLSISSLRCWCGVSFGLRFWRGRGLQSCGLRSIRARTPQGRPARPRSPARVPWWCHPWKMSVVLSFHFDICVT